MFNSPREARLGLALYSQAHYREQTAAVRPGFHIEDLLADRGGIHHIEILTAEHHTGDDGYRDFDGSCERAIGLVTDNFSAASYCRPQISFRVHRGAIRNSAEALWSDEQAFVGDFPGREIVVVCRDSSAHAVRAVKRAIVG